MWLIFSFILILLVLSYLIFILRTIKLSNLQHYCTSNSAVNSKSFTRTEIETNPNYAFWVSSDKNVVDKQELFIFREVSFAFIKDTNRFVYVNSTSNNSIEKVSSIMFTPNNAYGKKMDTNLLVFWSGNSYGISTYLFKFQENGNICTLEGGVSSEQEFIISLPKIGIDDGVNREFIGAYFYDIDGNLVYKIDGNF